MKLRPDLMYMLCAKDPRIRDSIHIAAAENLSHRVDRSYVKAFTVPNRTIPSNTPLKFPSPLFNFSSYPLIPVKAMTQTPSPD